MSDKEKQRDILGVHIKFWHAPASDMLRFLAIGRDWPLLRRLLEKTIPWMCKECMSTRRTMTKPLVKIALATRFNQRVQADLFFIFNNTYILMVDECLRYAISASLPSKTAESMLKAIFYSWIMYFGPMEILEFDPE